MAGLLKISSTAPPCLLLLLLLSFTIQLTTCARILDEVAPPAPVVDAPLPNFPVPTPPEGVISPTAAPETATTVAADAPQPIVDPVPTTPPLPTTVAPAAAAPVVPPQPSGGASAVAASASAVPAADGEHHPLTFFMHDVLGGTSPSARIVTGIVATSDFSGQLPFSKPYKDVFPINGAVPLPNGANGATINNNNVPYLTGLGGSLTSSNPAAAGIAQTNNGNLVNGGSNSIPFVTGGNLPAGSTLQNLLFGTTTVIDDELTEGHELGSAVIGKAQGFYVASSEDGTSQTVMFTALLGGGDYADTLSFFGVHRTAAQESHVAVVGGTGNYENARGYAAIQTIHLNDQHTTDGVETLLQISVYLS